MSDPATAMESLPWHEQLWQHVMATHQADRMAHGLLLCGPPGAGRRQFATRLAQALLCHAPLASGDGCGSCAGCRQWRAGAHADVSMLTPEEGSSVIKVDRVRTFTYQLQLTSQYQTGRLGWIEPAEQLNRAAANSLLKTLEEPPAGTHLLLITARPDRLLATIRSRCRIIRVPPAPVAMARDWLAARGVATDGLDDDALRMPLRQLQRDAQTLEREAGWCSELLALLAGRMDAFALAERWSKQTPEQLLEWLYRACSNLLAARLGAPKTASADWSETVGQTDVVRLRALCAGVINAAYLMNTNADWQLVLESVLARGMNNRGRA